MSRVAIVMDVDTGVDDAVALVVACGSPAIELIAVTCVGGNSDLANVVANTTAVLKLCGRSDVPVAAGSAIPLLGTQPFAGNAYSGHGLAGRGYADLPREPQAASMYSATDMLIRAARDRPGEITLITTGPLTNLALAIRIEPRLPALLRRWIVMGGAYAVAGSATPTAETNIFADPEAAKVAFNAFRDAEHLPFALGLDVTRRVRLTPAHIEELARLAGESLRVVPGPGPWGQPVSPVLRYLEGALRCYAEKHARVYDFYGIYLHDPLTLVAAISPKLFAITPVAVDVECSGLLTRGTTVADWRGQWGLGHNAEVAVAVDGERAIDAVVRGVSEGILGAVR